MKRSIILCGVLFLARLAFADTTDVILGDSMTSNVIPFRGGTYAAYRFQTVFLQSEINHAGRIIKFAFMPVYGATQTYDTLRLYFCHTGHAGDLSTTFDDNYDGNTPQLMFDSASCTFSTPAGQWLEFPVSYDYNNVDNLLLEIRWRGSSGSNTPIYVHWPAATGTYRVYNEGSDSAAAGSGDYVQYYAKLTIESAGGIEDGAFGERGRAPSLQITPSPVRTGESARISLNDPPGGAGAGLQIYGVNGRLVRSLAIGQAMIATWDLKDARGMDVSAGVYVVRCGRHAARVVVVD